MFRKLFGIGLLVLLLAGLFGGLGGRRSRAAYYEGYADGLQAQSGGETGEGAETAVPPPPAYRDEYGYGHAFGWGALGILGIFAFFFKFALFFFLFMFILRLIFGRRWRKYGPWGRGPWGHHKHGRGWPGREKSPKWMDDSDDDEPIMSV